MAGPPAWPSGCPGAPVGSHTMRAHVLLYPWGEAVGCELSTRSARQAAGQTEPARVSVLLLPLRDLGPDLSNCPFKNEDIMGTSRHRWPYIEAGISWWQGASLMAPLLGPQRPGWPLLWMPRLHLGLLSTCMLSPARGGSTIWNCSQALRTPTSHTQCLGWL